MHALQLKLLAGERGACLGEKQEVQGVEGALGELNRRDETSAVALVAPFTGGGTKVYVARDHGRGPVPWCTGPWVVREGWE